MPSHGPGVVSVLAAVWEAAGFVEVHLVSHLGNSSSGEFAYSLNVADIHTLWTETRAVLGQGQLAVVKALNEMKALCRFAYWHRF